MFSTLYLCCSSPLSPGRQGCSLRPDLLLAVVHGAPTVLIATTITTLVSCSTLYSVIDELRDFAPYVFPQWSGTLRSLPNSIGQRPYWQYGRDVHASDGSHISNHLYLPP